MPKKKGRKGTSRALPAKVEAAYVIRKVGGDKGLGVCANREILAGERL
eukprot:SAG31_NODE_18429_length_636_cov_2.735568_1_plen_47_part_10